MSGHPSTYEPKYAATKWLDQRLPIVRMGADFMTFPSPRNLNYWYTFGGILALCLVAQIITGIILAMHYVPHVDLAFESVQRIRRDVPFGWLLQPMHAVGASDYWLFDLPRNDGDWLPWLYTSMGSDVILGRDRDYRFLWRSSCCR